MRGFELFHGLFQFLRNFLEMFGAFFLTRCLMRRSFDQTSNGLGMFLVCWEISASAGFSFDSVADNSAFLSAGI